MAGRRTAGMKCQSKRTLKEEFALLRMTMLAVPSCLDLVHLRLRWSWHGSDTESQPCCLQREYELWYQLVLLSEHVPDVFFRRAKRVWPRFTELVGEPAMNSEMFPNLFLRA